MTAKEAFKDLPDDEHLRQDVAPEPGGEAEGALDKEFLPGQTNAGQQVSGLSSASGYGAGMDPDKQADENNPI